MMTRKEYKETVALECWGGGKASLIQKIRFLYFTPNTNCAYLARKMWYLFERGGLSRIRAKLIHLKILKKYGCVIFPYARVGAGFSVAHPVAIVLGNCTIGKNFTVYQGCTVGVKDDKQPPTIGDNVSLCANSSIIGHIRIADNVVIGAHSLVIKDIEESGVYAGSPVRKIK